jgi:hypothetical protein
MTLTPNGETGIVLIGEGTVTIDWGDGSHVETHEIKSHGGDNDDYTDKTYRHIYSGTSTHTITITGGNLTFMECVGLGLENLDVSRYPQLEVLNCYYNGLTSLDVSKNTKIRSLGCGSNRLTNLNIGNNAELYFLDCGGNLLSANALNDIFKSLNNSDLIEKTLIIDNNPGTADCQINFAEVRGWKIVEDSGGKFSSFSEMVEGEEAITEDVEFNDAEFMQKVKNAIAESDKEWLANHIHYPLNTTLNGQKKIIVKNRQQLIDNFEQIFFPAYKEQIEKHSVSDLFSNWQGTMLGNGEIWIDENIIIAINNDF